MTPITINSRGDPNECELLKDIETEIIRLKRLVASNKEQAIVRCNILLPQQMPKINKVLQIKDYMHNHYVETIFGRVLIEGSITFEVTYLSEESTKHNQFIGSATYYDFIDMREATSEMVADVKSIVESVTVIGFENENRTITVDVALNNMAQLYGFRDKTFITKLPLGYDGKFEKVTINKIVDVVKGCLKGSEEISIPSSHWPINKIIKCKSMPLLQNYEINLGSVTVYGWFKITVIYLDNKDQKQCVERFIHFSKVLAAPKAQHRLMSEAFVTAHQLEYSLLPDNLLLKYVASFKASVYEPITLNILTDGHYLNAKKEDIICESLADIQSVETIIRENCEINNELFDIEIKDIRVGPIKFFFKQLVNNKVLLRGYVDFLVGYTKNSDVNAKYLLKKGFFKAVVEVSNATSESKIQLVPSVNFTKAYFKEDKLTIYCLLNIIVKVSNLKPINFVAEISSFNSRIVAKNEVYFTYVMQFSDKLEELAARFGTTVEAINKANPQLTPPFANKRINIPCEVKKS
jgi:LysM repeat protein